MRRIAGHRFPVGVVYHALRLTEDGVRLRAVARILKWLVPMLGLGEKSPTYHTVRLWLLRVGLHQLLRPRATTNDWVWIVDHTQQWGETKVMILVGLRLSDWKPGEEPLAYDDLQLLAVEPVVTSTGEVVRNQFQAQADKTGVPRAIVSDNGRDLRCGVELFQQRHPRTAWIYDIKHLTASLLKHELENNADWRAFTAAANRTKQQCSMTDLAPLAPPTQRGKARYLNLGELVAWGHKVLRWLDDPRASGVGHFDQVKAEDRLGWLRDYRQQLHEWQAALNVLATAESYLRREGISRDIVQELKPQLDAAVDAPMSARLCDELLTRLEEQSQQLDEAERLPASSEVLESLIGKYKHLQGEQSHQGLTSMILGLGALLTPNLRETIPLAQQTTHVADLRQWCTEKLGTTLQSCRRQLSRLLANGTKPRPQLAPT
jgi:hypothetical protein